MRKSFELVLESLEQRQLLAVDGMLYETGSFQGEIERLRGLVLGRDSNAYVAPSDTEQSEFAELAAQLKSGHLAEAAAQASALDYELVRFTDTGSGAVLYELREQLGDAQPTRGWGTYVINAAFRSANLVEAPHPLFDMQTPAVAAAAFLSSGSQGLLMAGAHRHANGPGTADVAHLEESIFQSVHEAWSDTGSATTVWQIHGFNIDNHSFPTGSDVVLSNGDGSIEAEVSELDGELENDGFVSYAYNTLTPTDPQNVLVNDGADGQTFSSLGATTNVQGISSRALGQTFVHVELEANVRLDDARRDQAAAVLGGSLIDSNSLHIQSATLSDSSGGMQLTVDFSDAVDTTTVSAADLLVDGVAGASSVSMVDADTATFQLSPLLPGTYVFSFTGDSVANLAQRGLNAYYSTFAVANTQPGTKFYVVDTSGDEMFEYNAAGNLVVDNHLHNGNTQSRGATTTVSGDTIWVLDDDDHVYVYDHAGNSIGFWKASGLSRPEGIATDGTDIWIVDRGTDRVYHYAGAANLTSGTVSPTSDFELASGNYSPRGTTTDGTHLWVVNAAATDKVFKYSIDGTLQGSWAIDAANANPRGITIDPGHVDDIWVVDNGTDSVYQYRGAANRSSGSQASDLVFQLASGDTNPQGIADPPVSTASQQTGTVFPDPQETAGNAVGERDNSSDSEVRTADVRQAYSPASRASDDPALGMTARTRRRERQLSDLNLSGKSGVDFAGLGKDELLGPSDDFDLRFTVSGSELGQ